MSGKVQEKRNALRQRLIEVAEKTMETEGLHALRARDLAAEADCSVGAIYNVFGDLTDLILAVNGRTFRRLGEHVVHDVNQLETENPVEVLTAMGISYLEFAEQNQKCWAALFEVEMTTDMEVPSWYMEEMRLLLEIISKPLAQLYPELEQNRLYMFTRALFSSVHGIVLLGLEKRISAVPREDLSDMISFLLSNLDKNPQKI